MTQVTVDDVQTSPGYHADPGQSLSLLAAAYTEPAWFEGQKAVFARTWQWICHVEKVRAPGSYVAETVAGMPIVVVREGRDCVRSTTSAGTGLTSCWSAPADGAASCVPTTRGTTA